MKKKLTKELNKISDSSVILTILPKENYEDLNMHMVKLITDRKKNIGGAYVTINRPYANIINIMAKNDIDHEKMFFVDCVTEEKKEAKNCVFMRTPRSLTNIGIALEPVYDSNQHSFVFLDSLDALSIYHDPNMIIRFVRSLIEKVREKDMSGFMIGLSEETDKKIIDELSVVCDKVIDLTKK